MYLGFCLTGLFFQRLTFKFYVADSLAQGLGCAYQTFTGTWEHIFFYFPEITRGYWHQKADERHGNQELLVVRQSWKTPR